MKMKWYHNDKAMLVTLVSILVIGVCIGAMLGGWIGGFVGIVPAVAFAEFLGKARNGI